MTAEQTYFIRVLADHLHKRQTAAPQTALDWQALAALARTHQVDSILYYQCKSFLPEPQKSYCAAGYSGAVFYYQNRIRALREIGEAFAAQGIAWCAVKGLAVAACYPVPALRTMGDCDVVVSEQDMAQAKQTMRAMGYEGPDKVSPHDWTCNNIRDGLHFELHDQLVRPGEHATQAQQRYFNSVMDFARDSKLDDNFQFLFVLMHLCKHLMHKGVGIRQFTDVAAMIQNDAQLDWQKISELLETLEMQSFAQSCFALIESWFGITAPLPFERMDADTASFVTEKVLANGVFGLHDRTNRAFNAQNALILKKGPRWLTRTANLLTDVFLPYSLMISYPGCEFLKGRKLLLPAAWIYRFFYLLRRGDYRKAKKTIDQNFIPETELRERERYLEAMGLTFSKKEV